MNTQQDQRRLRQTRPTVEDLDSRIAPAVVSAVTLAAEIRVESHQVNRWESQLANSRPGSREHNFLSKHIARTEGRMAVQEARLARIDAPQPMVAASAMAVAVQPADEPLEPIQKPRPRDPWPPIHPFDASPTSSVSTITTASSTGSDPTTPAATTGSDPTTPAATTLPANVSQTLGVIYAAYQSDPSDFPADIPATDGANRVQIQGTSVGISLKDSNTGDFNTFVASLQSAGMQITDSSAQYGVVDGFLPVAQLPSVASLPDAPAVVPLFQPTFN
jgi:hypothetical protein